MTFSETMDTTSVTTNTSNTSCSGSFQVSSDNFSTCVHMSSSPSSSNSDKTYTVDPSDNFSGNTYYKIRVTTEVKDSSGNTLSSQYETTNGFVIVTTGQRAVLHQGYYWQSNNGSNDNGSVYCSNLSLSNRTWRVPKWTELKKLCLNPNSEIDVSRGSDNGTLMLVITDSNAPINPTPAVYGTMCMGYVGGNCTNPNTWCTSMYGGYSYDFTGWSIKCVSDP